MRTDALGTRTDPVPGPPLGAARTEAGRLLGTCRSSGGRMRVAEEGAGLPVRCSICGKIDYVSVDRFPEEYERLKEGAKVHHICASCANRLQAEALENEGGLGR
jgi:uncharacterized protein YlaI